LGGSVTSSNNEDDAQLTVAQNTPSANRTSHAMPRPTIPPTLHCVGGAVGCVVVLVVLVVLDIHNAHNSRSALSRLCLQVAHASQTISPLRVARFDNCVSRGRLSDLWTAKGGCQTGLSPLSSFCSNALSSADGVQAQVQVTMEAPKSSWRDMVADPKEAEVVKEFRRRLGSRPLGKLDADVHLARCMSCEDRSH
jgi:hypothetical protein